MTEFADAAADPRHRRAGAVNPWVTLGVLCLSLLIVGIDNSILNVALPTLVRELDATTADLQWIVDSYVVVFAGLMLAMGSLGDRYGRKGMLTLGLVVFGSASAVAAFSGGANALTACRAVMGVGAAMIMPATLSILANVFTDARQRRRAIAYWSLMNAAGSTIGPITGGVLLAHFSWGSVFLVNVPVVIAALVLGHLFVPTSRDPDAPRLDLIGAGLSIVGLAVLLWAIITGPEHGWASPATVGGVVVAFAVLALFVVWELHTPDPMLEMRFFRNMRLTAAATSVTIAAFSITGQMFLITQLLQLVKGYSPLSAALHVSLPIVIVNFALMPFSPGLTERFGPRKMVAGGLLAVTLGLVALGMTQPDSGYGNLLVGFCLLATGFSLFMPAATDSIMGALPKEKAGSGSAINQTTRQVGMALGVAVGGSLAASGFTASFDSAASGAGIPAAVADQARGSFTAALDTLAQLTGPLHDTLESVARTAFVDGIRLNAVVVAGVALLGAIFAFVALPNRTPSHDLNPSELLPTDMVVDDDQLVDGQALGGGGPHGEVAAGPAARPADG